MKNIAILAAIAALAVGASAQSTPKAPKATKTQKVMHCAVETGNKIDIAKATKNHMYADYKGNRYFFCCNGCPQAFKKDPAKYAKSDHIPTPKPTKAKSK